MLKKVLFIAFLSVLYLSAKAQTYAIGTTTITYQDPARSNRNIQTYLYYPAATAGANVPVATGTFPVVVIGHGFVMTYAAYTYLADTLVPKGYIVAIPNTETGFSPSHSNFGLDLAFLVSKLYSENSNNTALFYQHVQMTSCIAGHSMGGGCTFLGAAGNSNVTCTATFALAETTPSAISAATNITAPSLVFSGSDDCVAPAATNQTPAFNALPGCKVSISITDGGHCGFATSNFNCNFGEMSCNPGGPALPAATQRALTCRFLVPWLDHFLKSNGAAGTTFINRFNTSIAAGEITGINQCLALPLELVYFIARPQQDGILLEWQTKNERNMDHFTVEHSLDGAVFTPLETIKAIGNSTQSTDYQWKDAQPAPSLHYYRIFMANADGSGSYSPIRSVRIGEAAHHLFVFPNPCGRTFWATLPVAAQDLSNSAIQIFDAMGRLVHTQIVEEGARQVLVETDNLQEGVYWVVYENERQLLVKQF